MLRVCLALIIALAPTLALALNVDSLNPASGTVPVAQQGGDTPATYQVAVSSIAATLLRPAVTNRSRRKVCFENVSNYFVAIGTNTAANSNFYILCPLTPTIGGTTCNSDAPVSYCTANSGAYYAYISTTAALPGTALSANVDIIEETSSNP